MCKARHFLTLLLLFVAFDTVPQEKKTYKILTVAFYNLENLFDTINDPNTFDDDRTPNGKDHWTHEMYRDKLKSMAFVIGEIGLELTKNPPALIGLCELENRKVLEDLIDQPQLAKYDYGIVHFDSPDSRGIDVALLYRKALFRVKNAKSQRLLLYENDQAKKRDYTRDQLVVSGFLNGEEIHFIVNHWPSRYGGVAASSYKRELAAALNKKIIDSLQMIDPYAKIISMGDFNDDYFDTSLREVLEVKSEKKNVGFQGLFNPMANMAAQGIGSSAYRDGWNLFDQIILSKAFITGDYSGFQLYKSGVFNENFLINQSGKYKGYPFRSFGRGGYTGGYSDHFPVYVYLIKEAPSNSPKGGG